MDPGTAVRYPFGLASAGRLKVDTVAEWIRGNLPFTAVEAHHHRLGAARRSPSERPEAEVWDELLAGVDIIVDATAEVGLHYLISDLARGPAIPYIEAATRAGAWGGVIARVAGTGGTPCWLCYQFCSRLVTRRGGRAALVAVAAVSRNATVPPWRKSFWVLCHMPVR